VEQLTKLRYTQTAENLLVLDVEKTVITAEKLLLANVMELVMREGLTIPFG
jgi:hypothetical protein